MNSPWFGRFCPKRRELRKFWGLEGTRCDAFLPYYPKMCFLEVLWEYVIFDPKVGSLSAKPPKIPPGVEGFGLGAGETIVPLYKPPAPRGAGSEG